MLDISRHALAVASRRLGDLAERVEWIEGSVIEEDLGEATFDVWHDRGALHFLTDPDDQQRYARVLARTLAPGGGSTLLDITGRADAAPGQGGLPSFSPQTIVLEPIARPDGNFGTPNIFGVFLPRS